MDGSCCDDNNCVYYTSKIIDRGRYRALKISDDSMLPYADRGDTVIFRRQLSCEDHDAVVITVEGGQPILRRVKWCDGGITVYCDNPNYPSVYYSNDEIAAHSFVIEGKAVELRRRFENNEV